MKLSFVAILLLFSPAMEGKPAKVMPREELQNVDRLQWDQSKPIDFSLLLPCLESCMRKHNGSAPKSLDVVSVAEICENKNAAWHLWLGHGPGFCWLTECKAKEKHLGPVAREWAAVNCGW